MLFQTLTLPHKKQWESLSQLTLEAGPGFPQLRLQRLPGSSLTEAFRVEDLA